MTFKLKKTCNIHFSQAHYFYIIRHYNPQQPISVKLPKIISNPKPMSKLTRIYKKQINKVYYNPTFRPCYNVCILNLSDWHTIIASIAFEICSNTFELCIITLKVIYSGNIIAIYFVDINIGIWNCNCYLDMLS